MQQLYMESEPIVLVMADASLSLFMCLMTGSGDRTLAADESQQ